MWVEESLQLPSWEACGTSGWAAQVPGDCTVENLREGSLLPAISLELDTDIPFGHCVSLGKVTFILNSPLPCSILLSNFLFATTLWHWYSFVFPARALLHHTLTQFSWYSHWTPGCPLSNCHTDYLKARVWVGGGSTSHPPQHLFRIWLWLSRCGPWLPPFHS